MCSTAQAWLPAELKERGIVQGKSGANAFVLIAPSTGALRQCTAIIVSREAAFTTPHSAVVLGKLTGSGQPELLTAPFP